MDAVIVYESMFGATRQIAEALARGMSSTVTVTVVNVNDAGETFPHADLVLVGGPTHMHGMSRPETRDQAVEWTQDPERHLSLEPGAPGIGIREWLDGLTGPIGRFLAFDTRVDAARLLSGSAAIHIEKILRRAGGEPVAESESFLVHDNALDAGELTRAESVGARLAAQTAGTPA
jgi:ribosomal protein L18E